MADTAELANSYTLINDTQKDAGLFLLSRMGITKGMRVLDVGCGPGNLTLLLAEVVGANGSVVGLDPSTERIAIAIKDAPSNVSFYVGIAEDLSRFAASSYDAVFVNSTFHWVQDQATAMAEFARILKPGGCLGISGGSGDFVSAQERIKADVLSREPYRAYPEESPPRFLTRREIEHLLDNAGFSSRTIVVNSIVKSARNGEAMIDWLDSSSSGKTYGGIPLDLRSSAREEMKQEWDKLVDEDGIKMKLELLVTVTIRD